MNGVKTFGRGQRATVSSAKSDRVLAGAFLACIAALSCADDPVAPAGSGERPTADLASTSAGLTATNADSDRDALVALYRATAGPSWSRNDKWLTDAPLREWYGVAINHAGRVERLILWRNQLAGSIPPEIGNLTSLTSLELGRNALSGSIPPELGNLTSLTSLSLGGNRLVGSIPPEIGNLTGLTSLNLGDNGLGGSIPPEIGNLTNLASLYLSRNRLMGLIPPEIGNLTSLTSLGLEGNALSGSIPPELGRLLRLRYLWLAWNDLTGAIPRSFLEMNLAFFWFPENDGLCAPGTADFIEWAKDIDASQVNIGIIDYNGPFCNSADARVLLSTYESTSGEEWTHAEGWQGVEWWWMNVGPGGRLHAVAALDEWYGVTTDTLGRVTGLDLSNNGLTGRIPPDLWRLRHLSRLRLGRNALSGPLPASMVKLPLRVFRYAETDLCTPPDASFRDWISGLPSHTGTGEECTSLSYRSALAALYRATGGEGWTRSDNWLDDAPPEEWYGVEVDADGRIVGLTLDDNNLEGELPAEIGHLSHLSHLALDNNNLEGELPPELGDLNELTRLSIDNNRLSGKIPLELGSLANLLELRLSGNLLRGYWPELGELSKLEVLDLSDNPIRFAVTLHTFVDLSRLRVLDLSGLGGFTFIPVQFGGFSQLEVLDLGGNDLFGSIPPQFGKLSNLRVLDLSHDPEPRRGLVGQLSGPIPVELGRLSRLEVLNLRGNRLDSLPPELGELASLEVLDLSENPFGQSIPPELGNLGSLRGLILRGDHLSGSVPKELGKLVNLERLDLANNRTLSGPLPPSLAALTGLDELRVSHTELCTPSDAALLDWLQGTGAEGLPRCAGSNAYLTQAIQSLAFPVALVADEPALLRVFVTAPDQGMETIPPVEARFYVDGVETYLAKIPGGAGAIPTEMKEGSLELSANAEIPGSVIRPGLEMVIDIDPEQTLGPEVHLTKRIPERGRVPVDVERMPAMDLTVIPFLYLAAPDSSILDRTATLAGEDDLFWAARTLLPVRDLDVSVHEPLVVLTNNAVDLTVMTNVIRTMEGESGYYLGTMAGSTIGTGAAYTVFPASFSVADPWVIANQFGHNMSLGHAPCGSAGRVDPAFPYIDGSIGAWGYDFRDGKLIDPGTPDLMSDCGPPKWISEYHFTKALRSRLKNEGEVAAGVAAPTNALLLWGGVDERGAPFLESAFVVKAPPSLPRTGGQYQVSGHAADGGELFRLDFDMAEVAAGEGVASFVFTLPVQPSWRGSLASIVLSGPGGTAILDEKTERPAAILRDRSTGQVRAFLTDLPAGDAAGDRAIAATGALAGSARYEGGHDVAAAAGEQGLEVLTSRGLPDLPARRR